MSVWLLNICFFLLSFAALLGWLLFPHLNLHLANSNLVVIKTKLHNFVHQNRNSFLDIETKIQNKFENESTFEIVDVESSSVNDFRVIKIDFKYKNLFNKDDFKIQTTRIIFNDV